MLFFSYSCMSDKPLKILSIGTIFIDTSTYFDYKKVSGK